VLTLTQAVLMAGSLNLVGALTGVAVAKTVGNGIVDAKIVTQDLVVAALLSAIIWDLITWWLGLPTSSSHALIFSIIGASVAIHGLDVVILPGLQKTSFGIVYSPALAFIVGYLFMLALYWILRKTSYSWVQRFFGKAQILSSAYMAFSHGGNDGQKTMGVIALALYEGHHISSFYIPTWVKIAAGLTIAAGTYVGGWRIIRTLGQRIYSMQPEHGFATQLAAGTTLWAGTQFGFPISTTHVVTGSIMGAGATRRVSAVKWGVAGNILIAWLLTLPAAGLVAAALYYPVNWIF
jgi:PiT family inorganic phosphate transporter